MSLFDKLRRKATDTVDDHGDTIEQGVDKAADLADAKTGGRYGEKIEAGAEQAKDALDQLDGTADGDISADATPPRD